MDNLNQNTNTQSNNTSTNSSVSHSNSLNMDWLLVFLFAFFLGWLGVHRFYVGKIGTGLLMLFTLGGFGIWALIDTIIIACGKFQKKDGTYITIFN